MDPEYLALNNSQQIKVLNTIYSILENNIAFCYPKILFQNNVVQRKNKTPGSLKQDWLRAVSRLLHGGLVSVEFND